MILLRLERQARDKAVAGRYRLEEAADLICADGDERAGNILPKLMRAALEGSLPVYGPGEDARYVYGAGAAKVVREFYEEAYWNDLNIWLASAEPRLKFRFPTVSLDIPARAHDEASTSPRLTGNARKGRRLDALGREIEAIMRGDEVSDVAELHSALLARKGNGTILGGSESVIFWRNGSNGRKQTDRANLRDRLRRLRKGTRN